MNTRKKASLSFLAAAALAFQVLPASALEFAAQGDVLVVSGAVSARESEGFKAALTPAIKTVVLSKISGSGDMEEARRLGGLIKDAGATTVVQGRCSLLCSYLYLAGKERLFAAGKLESTSVTLVGTRDKKGGPVDKASSLLLEYVSVPGDLWLKYVFPYSVANGAKPPELRVYHPDAKVAPATVFGCDSRELKLAECTPLNTIDALGIRFITSKTLFPVPAIGNDSAAAPGEDS